MLCTQQIFAPTHPCPCVISYLSLPYQPHASQALTHPLIRQLTRNHRAEAVVGALHTMHMALPFAPSPQHLLEKPTAALLCTPKPGTMQGIMPNLTAPAAQGGHLRGCWDEHPEGKGGVGGGPGWMPQFDAEGKRPPTPLPAQQRSCPTPSGWLLPSLAPRWLRAVKLTQSVPRAALPPGRAPPTPLCSCEASHSTKCSTGQCVLFPESSRNIGNKKFKMNPAANFKSS